MIATVAALFVAVEHVLFMVLETFLWTTPSVRKRFGQSEEQAERSKVLAANQGVYNGALAASLAWATLAGDMPAQRVLLGFVVVVGLYGGYSAKRSIIVVQAVPAAAALALTYVP